MEEKQKVRVHFILDQAHWASRFLYNIPRVGDEVRFNNDSFLKLKALFGLWMRKAIDTSDATLRL